MKKPLTFYDLNQILIKVQYLDWEFRTGPMASGYFLQVNFFALAADGEALEQQHGRKWYVSPYMTESEVVQTAFKAIQTAIEHEARETFKYRGHAIYGPHFSADKLVQLCQQNALETRSTPDESKAAPLPGEIPPAWARGDEWPAISSI